MLLTTAAGGWGITGEQFLLGYGALCAAAGAGVWTAYRRALGPPAGPLEPLPDLAVAQIALINEGPDAATTAAAARLYYDGIVRGTDDGTLAATGELEADAEPVEREVFETVRREPGLSVEQIRERVCESATMQALSEPLRRTGLLLEESQARRVRRLWIAPALLSALGVLRILTGLAEGRPVLVLCIMTAIAGAAAAWLLVLRPTGTRRGNDAIERLRRVHDPLPGRASASQIALTAALFGVGTLWLAESAIASALGVPREEDPSVGTGGGGCGGGCGGGGCGGCGCGG